MLTPGAKATSRPWLQCILLLSCVTFTIPSLASKSHPANQDSPPPTLRLSPQSPPCQLAVQGLPKDPPKGSLLVMCQCLKILGTRQFPPQFPSRPHTSPSTQDSYNSPLPELTTYLTMRSSAPIVPLYQSRYAAVPLVRPSEPAAPAAASRTLVVEGLPAPFSPLAFVQELDTSLKTAGITATFTHPFEKNGELHMVLSTEDMANSLILGIRCLALGGDTQQVPANFPLLGQIKAKAPFIGTFPRLLSSPSNKELAFQTKKERSIRVEIGHWAWDHLRMPSSQLCVAAGIVSPPLSAYHSQTPDQLDYDSDIFKEWFLKAVGSLLFHGGINEAFNGTTFRLPLTLDQLQDGLSLISHESGIFFLELPSRDHVGFFLAKKLRVTTPLNCVFNTTPYLTKDEREPPVCLACVSIGHNPWRCSRPPSCSTCGQTGHRSRGKKYDCPMGARHPLNTQGAPPHFFCVACGGSHLTLSPKLCTVYMNSRPAWASELHPPSLLPLRQPRIHRTVGLPHQPDGAP